MEADREIYSGIRHTCSEQNEQERTVNDLGNHPPFDCYTFPLELHDLSVSKRHQGKIAHITDVLWVEGYLEEIL